MGETNFNEMKKTALLKRLSGGDIIGFEYKNKNPFDDVNYAKIIIATNSLPITHDKTIGYYRRWMIIDFPNQFTEKKDILKEIPDIEYVKGIKKCVNLLKELLNTRAFHNEGSIEDRRKKYEDISNPLQKFLSEKTVNSVDGHIPKFEFKELFVSWMGENGYRIWSDNQIGSNMKNDYGFEDKKIYLERDGEEKYWRCWVGISWV